MLHPAVNQLPDPLAVPASEVVVLGQDIHRASYRGWWSSRWGLFSRWEAIKSKLNECSGKLNVLYWFPDSVGKTNPLQDQVNNLRLDLYACLEILAAKEDLMFSVSLESLLENGAFLRFFWHWDSYPSLSILPAVHGCIARASASCFSWKLNKCCYVIG